MIIRLVLATVIAVLTLGLASWWVAGAVRGAHGSRPGPRTGSETTGDRPVAPRGTAPPGPSPAAPRKPVVASFADGGREKPATVVQKAAPAMLAVLSGGLSSQDGFRLLATLSEAGQDAADDPTSVYSFINRAVEATDVASMESVLRDLRDRMSSLRREEDASIGNGPRGLTVALMVCVELVPRVTGADGEARNQLLERAQAAALYSGDLDLRQQLAVRIGDMAVRPRDLARSTHYAAVLRNQMQEASWIGNPRMLEQTSRLWLSVDWPQTPQDRARREQELRMLMLRARGERWEW
ncbi:MAG: hypothetical protein IT438_07150 [Phycisphaerales bacterium]|nr:hypothetical protein [Phycisphaerales bacterium]